MPYDPTKDEALGSWENEETGLIISIIRYGEGEPKLQIGPRSYKRKDGTKSTNRAGRLTIDDVLWFDEILEEVKEKMNAYFLSEE